MKLKIKTILTSFFLVLMLTSAQEPAYYVKEYFANKKMKAEGWMEDGVKVRYWKYYNAYGTLKSEGHYANDVKKDYWFFYHFNGNKAQEGRFLKGKKSGWWSFYNTEGELIEKCCFKNGLKEGYRFIYEDSEPIRAEKFEADRKVGEWTNYHRFIIENREFLKS